MDASRFVVLDETGTATNMTRRYGFVTLARCTCFYCPSGESQVVQFQWFKPTGLRPEMASTCLM